MTPMKYGKKIINKNGQQMIIKHSDSCLKCMVNILSAFVLHYNSNIRTTIHSCMSKTGCVHGIYVHVENNADHCNAHTMEINNIFYESIKTL